MMQIFAALFMIALLAFAFKLAIIVLLVAGLIFRTREVLGLLLIGWIIAGFNMHPLIGGGLVIVLIIVSLYFKRKEEHEKLQSAPDG